MDMEKNKKLKVFIGTLIFSMLFALLFKWWTTGISWITKRPTLSR